MQIETLANGNLRMLVSDELERRAISRMRDKQSSACESRFIKRFLKSFTNGTDKYACCGAPIIEKGGENWAYMDYAVCSFIENLIAGHTVIWTKG